MMNQPFKVPAVRKGHLAIKFATFASITVLAMTGMASAQDEGSQNDSASAVLLDTITVRARLVDEAVEDVPFSVTVIDKEEIEKRRNKDLESVLLQTPGVAVNSWGDTMHTAIRIRGVGALFKTSIDDSSVVIHINGLPQSSASATMSTMDMETIEVLKGPQGTLFGRNSEGGVINIKTARPTRHFEGYVNGEIGTEGQRRATGVISGALSETLSGRLALSHWGADNVLTNIQDGYPLTNELDFAARGTLLWQPDDRTDVTFIAEHEPLLNRSASFVLRPYGPDPEVDVPPGEVDDDKTVTRLITEATRDLGFAMVTSVTGYSRTDNENTWDGYDGLIFGQLLGFDPDGIRTQTISENLFNQEVRLSSRPGDSVFWVAGANYYHTDRTNHHHDVSDTLNPNSPYTADITRNFEINSAAIFGEVTYPLTDALKVTGGLRHTWDDKSYDAVWIPTAPHMLAGTGTVYTDRQKVVDDYTTGRAALNYEIIEGLYLHGIYAYGYKSAGFNDDGGNIGAGLPDEPYDPAQIDSYEIGFKFRTPDGRFWLNGAVFFNETKDDHLVVPNFGVGVLTFQTENLDTESKGAELEFAWDAGNGLSFTGGLAYIDAIISKVPADSLSGAKAGNGVPDVPKWSATLSVTHEKELPSFLGMTSPMLVSTVTNSYVGKRPADVANNFDLAAYNKLDARIGVRNGPTQFYLWGDNLLDEHYDLYGTYFDFTAFGGGVAEAGRPARGRTFGIGLMHKFL